MRRWGARKPRTIVGWAREVDLHALDNPRFAKRRKIAAHLHIKALRPNLLTHCGIEPLRVLLVSERGCVEILAHCCGRTIDDGSGQRRIGLEANLATRVCLCRLWLLFGLFVRLFGGEQTHAASVFGIKHGNVFFFARKLLRQRNGEIFRNVHCRVLVFGHINGFGVIAHKGLCAQRFHVKHCIRFRILLLFLFLWRLLINIAHSHTLGRLCLRILAWHCKRQNG